MYPLVHTYEPDLWSSDLEIMFDILKEGWTFVRDPVPPENKDEQIGKRRKSQMYPLVQHMNKTFGPQILKVVCHILE